MVTTWLLTVMWFNEQQHMQKVSTVVVETQQECEYTGRNVEKLYEWLGEETYVEATCSPMGAFE